MKKANSKPNFSKRVTLEKVIGLNIRDNFSVSINQKTGEVAYIAGSIIVIYDPKTNKQTQFLSNDTAIKSSITSVAFSENGKYIAAGEYGPHPSILIWDTTTGQIVCELKGHHKYGVACVTWSPDGRYIVSIGHEQDPVVNLWDWKTSKLVACSKTAKKRIYSVAFAADGSYFVIAGEMLIKLFHLSQAFEEGAKISKKTNCTLIEGKKCNLKPLESATFVDVAFAKGKANSSFYGITSDGTLAMFTTRNTEKNEKSTMIDKWVSLKAEKGFSISCSELYISVGCSDGTIRLFSPETLQFCANAPKPAPIFTNSTFTPPVVKDSVSKDKKYGHVISCQIYHDNSKLIATYSDRSFFVWDITNVKKFGRVRSFLHHSDAIYDIDVVSDHPDCPLPLGTFATCSADNTIRLWNLESNPISTRDSIIERNMYCKYLIKAIKISNDTPSEEDSEGVKCIKFNGNGTLIASGDRSGVLRVHELRGFQEILNSQAHESEILSIDYSNELNKGEYLLASGSRDRLVHLFYVKGSECNYVSTLDDHSASITSVKFAEVNGLKLISSAADKSIIFRSYKPSEMKFHFEKYQYTSCAGTVFDMDVDATNKYIASSGADKKINIWNIEAAKTQRTYKTDSAAGDPFKVKIGPGGINLVISSSDRIIRLYDFYSGECIAKFKGHSDSITAVKFSNDCKRIISVSADGCIFVWQLSSVLSKAMQDRLNEINAKKPKPESSTPLPTFPPTATLNLGTLPTAAIEKAPSPPSSARFNNNVFTEDVVKKQVQNLNQMFEENNTETKIPLNSNLDTNAMPIWGAKRNLQTAKKLGDGDEEMSEAPAENSQPKGNVWAQRAGTVGYKLFSHLPNTEAVVDTNNEKRRFVIEPDDKTIIFEESQLLDHPIETDLVDPSSDSKEEAKPSQDDEEVLYCGDDEPEISQDFSLDAKVPRHESPSPAVQAPQKAVSPTQSSHTSRSSSPLVSGKEPQKTIGGVPVRMRDSTDSFDSDEKEDEFEQIFERPDFLARNFANVMTPYKRTSSAAVRLSISTNFLAAKDDFTKPEVKLDTQESQKPRMSIGTLVKEIRNDSTVPLYPPPVPPEQGNAIYEQLKLLKTRYPQEVSSLVSEHKQLMQEQHIEEEAESHDLELPTESSTTESVGPAEDYMKLDAAESINESEQIKENVEMVNNTEVNISESPMKTTLPLRANNIETEKWTKITSILEEANQLLDSSWQNPEPVENINSSIEQMDQIMNGINQRIALMNEKWNQRRQVLSQSFSQPSISNFITPRPVYTPQTESSRPSTAATQFYNSNYSSVISSAQSIDVALERYSDILVQMVAAKIDAKMNNR